MNALAETKHVSIPAIQRASVHAIRFPSSVVRAGEDYLFFTEWLVSLAKLFVVYGAGGWVAEDFDGFIDLLLERQCLAALVLDESKKEGVWLMVPFGTGQQQHLRLSCQDGASVQAFCRRC